jgi:hypothetical protein
MKIDFSTVLHVYKTCKTVHCNNASYETLIASYDCFNDVKWSSKKPKQRVKIGNADTSPETIYKKELVLSMNKLTSTNMETVGGSILKNFKMIYVDTFVAVVWEYFKRQPVFQDIYIKLIEKLADYDEVRDKWSMIFQTYINDREWECDYNLIDQSHNYNDFCEYIKKKKEMNAMAQGWARLMNIGIITTDVFAWCFIIIKWSVQLDLSNVVYKTMIDSYIEQVCEYCKYINYPIPIEMITTIEEIKNMNIQKSTKFKIEDFLRENKK